MQTISNLVLLCVALLSLCLVQPATLDVGAAINFNKRFAASEMSASHVDTKMTQDETSIQFWLQAGKAFVQRQLASSGAPQRGVAKNMILFLGDGMSLATLVAARVYVGGEEQQLSFERFPYTGLAKTYAIDNLVADSACSSTALLCGVKSVLGTIGVNGQVKRRDCKSALDPQNQVDSIGKWALDSGKSVGLVTTTRLTHATPAGLYAHTSERDWENDSQLKRKCAKKAEVQDLALQLIAGDVGKQLKVALGGGKAQFIDKDFYGRGQRSDGRHLINEFLSESGNSFVESKSGLKAVNATRVNRLLGLFHDDHLEYNLESDAAVQPTLSEMTSKAIEVLSTNPNGFFLLVEGGKIDLAHHQNKARLALDETSELSKAVLAASHLVNNRDTLMVVTADHSHSMSISGYAPRGNSIFGVGDKKADDDESYLTLSYANGPGFDKFFDTAHNERIDPYRAQRQQLQDSFPATVPLAAATHGAEDVPVFATGPWSHLFTGVYEQSTIPHLMAFAGCVGNGLKACDI